MKPILENKKVRMEYEILDRMEAGISLTGFEVKALRAGKGMLAGSRVLIRGGEAYLVGATIPPYQERNTPAGYDPERSRRLLISKKEIGVLADSEGKKGLTIVPIMVYNKNNRLKLEIAVARHKKKYDKREALKERDSKRAIERSLKNQD